MAMCQGMYQERDACSLLALFNNAVLVRLVVDAQLFISCIKIVLILLRKCSGQCAVVTSLTGIYMRRG